jgi:hypothetical protein
MIVIQKYANMAEARFKISGGIVGGAKTNVPFEDLVGKTITFLNPTGACTFVQPAGIGFGQLRFADLKSQIEASIGLLNVDVVTINNLLGFRHRVHGQAIRFDALDEVARNILGFENNNFIGGVFLNGPSGSLPRYLEFVTDNGAVYVSAEFSSSDRASAATFDATFDSTFG